MQRLPQRVYFWFAILLLAGVFGCSGSTKNEAAAPPQSSAEQQQAAITIGGEPAVVLHVPAAANSNTPQFTEATFLPGRGMALLQLKANVPGKGAVDVLMAPSLQDAKQLLDNGDDEFGNKIFTIGGAFLVPYANRIRGKASADGKTITTTIAGKTVTLPANWQGKKPGAEKVSMHGLINSSHFQDVSQQNGADSSTVGATLHAGDFGGHWLSQTDLHIEGTLKANGLDLTVTAKNVGQEAEPMAIGWHPYFALPSGNRPQGKLHLPAEDRALANNYDDVLPTGKVVPVKGTPYDFTAADGKPLDQQFVDDNFQHLIRNSDGAAMTEVIDPAANYGVRISALSPEIKAIQVYSPLDKSFVAVEPQFNFPDPYGKEWHGANTGMVTLKPGDSVSWKVRVELFTPAAK